MLGSILIKLGFVTALSFLLNTLLGIWRVRTKRFSIQWIAAIHLAVPLIFFLRVSMELAYWVIPVLVMAAILGQIAGGIISKRSRNFYFLMIRRRSKYSRNHNRYNR